MSAVDVTKDLWQIQNVVGFVSIIKWHITCRVYETATGMVSLRPYRTNLIDNTKF